MNLKQHKKLFILIAFMFIFYTTIGNTFSIYRETKNDSIKLNILDPVGMVNVTFDPNGGTIDASDSAKTIQSGTAIGQLPIPSRTDYNFLGWYTDPSSGSRISEQTIVTGTTVTYYAHWAKIVCKPAPEGTLHSETCASTGSCAASYGGYNANDTIYYGTIPGNNSPIVGDAYDCDVNDDGVWDSATERFYYVRSYGTTDPNENAVLVHYTSFDENGQMDSSTTRGSYEYNEAITYLPTSSTWTNPALIEMNGNVTRLISIGDITAACGSASGGNKFETCRFYLENSRYQSKSLGRAGIWLEKEGTTYHRYHTETLSVLTPESTSKNTARPTIQIPSNTIEGNDGTKTYTVTFNPNGGSIAPEDSTRSVYNGDAIGNLPTPTYSGNSFLGWFTDQNNGTQISSSTVINGNVTYYAHWHEDVTVTLHLNGGEGVPNTITVPYNTAIGTIPTPTKANNTFGGWYKDQGFTTPVTAETVITTNTDFYAKWIPNVTVTLNANNGTVSPSSITVAQGSAVGSLPIPERTGYTFEGWYQNQELTTPATAETIVNASTTYYANWIENITITFDADGGTVSPNSRTIIPGTAIGELPIPNKENYIFAGWFMDNTYQTEVTDQTVFNTTTSILAKWIEDNNVACIDTTCYTSLATAVDNVPTTGVKTTIRLLKNITQEDTISIESTKNIELDLQSYTITGGTDNIMISNSGTLHIINGTLLGNGAEVKHAYTIDNLQNATLNISGGLVKSTTTNVISNAGNINITGGRIEANSQSAAINNNQYGVLNMSSGEIVGTHTTKGQAIYNNLGTLTISGTAYLENTSQSGSGSGRAAVHNNAGTVTILGGTIISKKNAAVKNNDTMTIGTAGDAIDITNPVFQGYNYGLEAVSGKTTVIYDGIFKGRVSTNNKAISNESVVNTGTATIVHTTETIDGYPYDVAYLEDQTVNYTVTFNVNGGDSVSRNTQTYSAVEPIGELPTATKANTEFLGWFTAATGGEKILTTTQVDADITYYAHYTRDTIVCKPATSLHSSSGVDFGQKPSNSTLSGGDAFDCDVNGDGTYDSADERFYYLTDTSDGKAVFIFYNNVTSSSGITSSCGANGVNYASTFTEGPTTAMAQLPTTTEWSNVSLYTEPRTITTGDGTTVVNDFAYTGKAARFANLDEIKAATNSSINGTTDEFTSYPFILENTVSMDSNCRSNYWIETTYSNNSAYRINGAANAKNLGHASGTSAVRPVIEVPYSSIEGVANIVEFDTIPAAMRTYFNSVGTWNAGQDDTNYSSFNSAMITNLNNYNCAYYNNDNTSTQYGSVFCDQPNQYDTGVTGDVNVYEYDESTGTRSNNIANYVSNNNGKLYNFIPGKTYYWESVSDSTKNGYVKPTGERRLITIPGTNRQVRNVRDLGGLPVDTDGDGNIDGTVKYQKMYRGEKIWGTSHNGVTRAQFEKLGIYNEYDLRTQGSEINASEEDQLSNYIPYEIVHYKIDHTEFGSAASETRFNGKSYYQLTRDAAIDVMQKIVAGNDDYAIFFHCRIGADRTGTLAYILEGLLGVPTEYRYQDYELTTFFGLRERTRYYYKKDSTNDTYKFLYLKKAIRHATPNNDENTGVENVMDWFLLEGNSTSECSDISALINQFRSKMINYN